MRLFLANVPKSELAKQVQQYQESLKAIMPDVEIKWEYTSQLHMTLLFLGAVDKSTTKELCGNLAFAFDSIERTVARVEELVCFPDIQNTRALALRVSSDNAVLNELHNQAVLLATRAEIPTQKRVFLPHITLARFKKAINLESIISNHSFEPFNYAIDKVQLIESSLQESGVRYQVLAETDLDQAPIPL